MKNYKVFEGEWNLLWTPEGPSTDNTFSSKSSKKIFEGPLKESIVVCQKGAYSNHWDKNQRIRFRHHSGKVQVGNLWLTFNSTKCKAAENNWILTNDRHKASVTFPLKSRLVFNPVLLWNIQSKMTVCVKAFLSLGVKNIKKRKNLILLKNSKFAPKTKSTVSGKRLFVLHL